MDSAVNKRIFDFCGGMLGYLLVSPILVGIAVCIVIKENASPFFIQERVGKDGRRFRLIKFRTMRVRPETDEKRTITVAGDNRVTDLGRILRKWKLDELPSLVNVMLGQMSFVGPRPDVPGYADCLEGDARRILQLRPGITGPATLKYANEEELLAGMADPKRYNDQVLFPDKVRINLQYMENRTLSGDVRLILKTLLRSDY